MAEPLAVVLLPGPGAIEATLTSVRSEIDKKVPLLRLAPKACESSEQPPALVSATPQEILTAADVLAFARAGDRWCAGALAARMRPLSAHPTAMLSVASYVLMDSAGAEVRVTHAPMPPINANELLVHPSIEPAAVLVRSSALNDAALELIASPYGDAAVWSEIVRRYGLLPSGEIAAEVALDPDRHGHDPTMRTKALLAALHAGKTSEEPGSSTLRRELLRRLYVEPLNDPGLAELDIATLFAANTTPAIVAAIADLRWALERQRDALATERLRWGYGEIDAVDSIPATTDADLQDALLKAEEIWNEVKVRNAEIERLKAEIMRRDAEIARLSAAGQLG
jgi:hypothetical protein